MEKPRCASHGSAAAERAGFAGRIGGEPALERTQVRLQEMQTELRAAPEYVSRGVCELLPAQVVDFALMELRQQLFAEFADGAGATEQCLDARTVGMRVAPAQTRWQPRIAPLECAQEHGETALRQLATREQRPGSPGWRAQSKRVREKIDGVLREAAVGGDLAAKYGEQRRGLALELECIVACDAHRIARLIFEQRAHAG